MKKYVKEGDVIFDVGAHVGFYTLFGSVLVGDSGQVISFEPVPDNLVYLRNHLQMNSVTNVTVVEAAVSDFQGICRLSSGPSSSMWHLEDEGELEVQTVSLDELVLDEKIPPPNVIKMDIEGAEILALNGSARLIDKFHPILFLSTHGNDLHQKCRRFLSSAKYRLIPIDHPSLDKCRELLAIYGAAT